MQYRTNLYPENVAKRIGKAHIRFDDLSFAFPSCVYYYRQYAGVFNLPIVCAGADATSHMSHDALDGIITLLFPVNHSKYALYNRRVVCVCTHGIVVQLNSMTLR